MATVTKVIKPSRLKQPAMRAALLAGMDKVGKKILADFEKTTATWDHKVKFEVLADLSGPGPYVIVDTDDEIYGYVNNGTRPHLIFPKKPGGRLAFPSGYHDKTTPGVIGSHAGGSFGPTVFRPYVEHPGTEARNFDAIIAKIWGPRFKREMEPIMANVARASGHSIGG